MKKVFYSIGLLYAFLFLSLGFTSAYAIRHTNEEMQNMEKEMRDLKSTQASMQPQLQVNNTIYTFQQYNSYKKAYESVKYKLIAYSSDEIVLKQVKDTSKTFILKEKEGLLIVYLEDGRTIYEYTAIAVSDLPAEVQQDLKEGITIDDADSLYSFLEHYSS